MNMVPGKLKRGTANGSELNGQGLEMVEIGEMEVGIEMGNKQWGNG